MRRNSQLRAPTGTFSRPAGVNIVVALKAEARPLIAHYGFRSAPPCAGYTMHQRDHLRLIVTGVGRAAAAAATKALSHLDDPHEGTRAWLNIGLAGHGQLPPGSLLTASEVMDRVCNETWSLTPILNADLCPAVTVDTVDTVEHHYDPPDHAFEMEASGFCKEALRAAPPSWVGCLKVVSDGPGHSPELLNAKGARALIARHLDHIDHAIRNLMDRSHPLPNP